MVPIFERISAHAVRLSHQFGRKVRLGDRTYRYRGYISNDFAADSRHEPHLIPALRRVLAIRTGPFIDVGANLGQTLCKLLALEPERPYLGFEPQLAACSFIHRFAMDNRLGHVRVLPIALSDRDELLPFYARGESDPMGSLASDHEGPNSTLQSFVQARVGDTVLQEMGVNLPGIIKIDVEGVELRVLRGLSGTLERARPVLFLEVLPMFEGWGRTPLPEPKRSQRAAEADEIFDILSTHGYQVHQILQDGDEQPIDRFVLDRPDAFVGFDYVAHPI